MTLIPTPRYETHEWVTGNTQPISFQRHCALCDGHSVITVDKDKYIDWAEHRVHVQDVWPLMSIGMRETIISGSHSDCFDEVFKDDD